MNDVFTPAVPTPRAVCGICRCAPGQHREPSYDPPPSKPEPGTGYEIEKVEEVYVLDRTNLVMQVNFRCSFEGSKLMVFAGTKLRDAILWKKIDPHFRRLAGREVDDVAGKRSAPPPAARFPATEAGWKDAIAFARSK